MLEVIRLDEVSLWRRTQEEFSYDLKKVVFSVIQGKYRQPLKKQVLHNINLSIGSGEKIGIIGSNGSGKSTLLKIICGILQPTVGQVRVRGVIAPLIELGAGFEPNLSVIDNILLYGVLLGFSRQEMMQRCQSIVEFAGLEDYSLVPVKGLSSGMIAKLGFSIATDVQPDILILDEVLSVGDENFKRKCQQRIDSFLQANATVLLVSHDLKLISEVCDRAIWLDRGKIKLVGAPKDVVSSYKVNMEKLF